VKSVDFADRPEFYSNLEMNKDAKGSFNCMTISGLVS